MIRFLILLYLVTGFKECIALKNVKVKHNPEKVFEGDDVEFTCKYDLEDDILYSIKWFKGQYEFLRYTQDEIPQIKVFSLKNINVDVSASSLNKVKLLNVSKGTRGQYTCEVTLDAPTFRTMASYKELVVRPDHHDQSGDINTVVPAIVNISDTEKISCSYSPSQNDSSLKSVTWKKNGVLFYKYEPDTEFNIALHKLPGINFSVKQTSNFTEITLHKATADTEGEYTCQIDYGSATFTSSRILLVKEETSRAVTVTVPALVHKGENVKLKCQYNLNGFEISGVKWFKGNRQFYSYTPDEEPTITSFDGVDVQDLITEDVYRSFVSTILLKQVNFNTAGRYRCEVSTKRSYEKLSDSGILTVFRLPHGEPIVLVENDYLKEGNYIHAECASPPSYPYANITWFLNGNRLWGKGSKDSNTHMSTGFPSSAISKLSERVEFHYEKTANLTCVVTISDVYRKEKTVKIEKDDSDLNIFNDHIYAMASGHNLLVVPIHIITIVLSLVLLNW